MRHVPEVLNGLGAVVRKIHVEQFHIDIRQKLGQPSRLLQFQNRIGIQAIYRAHLAEGDSPKKTDTARKTTFSWFLQNDCR